MNEQRIVDEFQRLLEKSKQLFNGLRELPLYGHKHWQSYFGRTFDVYTKLWKFQQQYRQILDAKAGLKRWQIGEIASKIGQLYYHYYLRTSETNYLFESFAFYAAIRQRQYYDIETERRGDLVVKKLRYYARFIVVCLLLNRTKLLDELLAEFSSEVERFAVNYGPDEQLEWSNVVDELRGFLHADRCVEVVDMAGNIVPLVHRLTPFSAASPGVLLSGSASSPAGNLLADQATDNHGGAGVNPFGTFAIPGVQRHLRLQEAVIVGASHNQPRFSELTIDAFRIAQATERQPDDGLVSAASRGATSMHEQSPAPVRKPGSVRSPPGTAAAADGTQSATSSTSSRRDNPHKYLVYRPTFAQLFSCIAAAHRDVSPNGVLLVYLSSDAAGCLPPEGFNEGGIHDGTSPRLGNVMMESASFGGGEPLGIGPTDNWNATQRPSGNDVYEDLSPQRPEVFGGTSAQNTGGRSSVASKKLLATGEWLVSGQDGARSVSPDKCGVSEKDRNCLYPGDLYPFLRKPLVLIVDSENSSAFLRLPRLFGQPAVALLSPTRLPPGCIAASQRRSAGSLFTLFLHSPLAAICFLTGVRAMSVALWDRCQAVVHKFFLASCRLFAAPPPPPRLGQNGEDTDNDAETVDPSYVAMFSDDFLRSFILRFCLCHYVLGAHSSVLASSTGSLRRKGKQDYADIAAYLPMSSPPLPKTRILRHAQLASIIAELVSTLGVADQFPGLMGCLVSPHSRLLSAPPPPPQQQKGSSPKSSSKRHHHSRHSPGRSGRKSAATSHQVPGAVVD